jgi:replicative DNA helicase
MSYDEGPQEVVEERTEYRKSRKLGDIMQERVLDLEVRRDDPEKYRPTPTHIDGLNNLFGGLPTQEDPFMLLVLASSKLGKTTFGMNLADAWRAGIPEDEGVLYVQLEELSKQYADRVFSEMTSLTKDDIRMLRINDEQMREMEDAANKVSQGSNNLLIQDDLFSLEAIIEECVRLGIKRIVIDNLQLVSGAGFSERERIATISRKIATLRNQEGYSIVVISQESSKGRAFGSEQPKMDADLIIEMGYVFDDPEEDDPEKATEGLRLLRVPPSRISKPGKVEVAFDGRHNKISNITTRNINEKGFIDFLKEEGPEPIVRSEEQGDLL